MCSTGRGKCISVGVGRPAKPLGWTRRLMQVNSATLLGLARQLGRCATGRCAKRMGAQERVLGSSCCKPKLQRAQSPLMSAEYEVCCSIFLGRMQQLVVMGKLTNMRWVAAGP